MNSENAILVLNTRGLTEAYINGAKSDMTWPQIDLKQVMGSMYDKYELFNISLVSYAMQGETALYGNNSGNKKLYMGLPFDNSSYDPILKCNTTSIFLTPINIRPQSITTVYFDNRNCFTFDKSQSIVDIRLFFTNADTDNPFSGGVGNWKDHVFLFEIYGIK